MARDGFKWRIINSEMSFKGDSNIEIAAKICFLYTDLVTL